NAANSGLIAATNANEDLSIARSTAISDDERGRPGDLHSVGALARVSSSQGKLPSPSSHRTGLVGLTSGSSGRRGRQEFNPLIPTPALRPAAIPGQASAALERRHGAARGTGAPEKRAPVPRRTAYRARS